MYFSPNNPKTLFSHLAARGEPSCGDAIIRLYLVSCVVLTSITGVARVVAVVAGDSQNPVLDVVHPVGCHFGAAVY